MRILGIDPGSRKAGYGIIEVKGRSLSYVTSGVFHFAKVDPFMARLGTIYSDFYQLVEEFAPDQVAIESLIHVKNVTSLAKLSQARGAIVAACTNSRTLVPVEYSPNLVKSTVTGHGHASKDVVDRTLGLLLGARDFETDDESDALAIAICHSLLKGQTVAGSSSNRSLKNVFKGRGL
jgi:crossover junction endodeoxyribonuclease RuvC